MNEFMFVSLHKKNKIKSMNMKTFLQILKWIGRSIGLLIILIILAGITFRLLGPNPQKPAGKLVDMGDFKLHINSSGEKNSKPTLVIEAGLGMSSDYYHWLSEGLKDSLRVVRYDRSGIGYSELSNEPRDIETVAHELHTLLKNVGESPPYILAGHSYGGLFIKVFTELYPDEVEAMIFIDTTHPEQVERLNAAAASSFRFKSMIWTLHGAAILADLGVLGLVDKISGPILAGEGLPNEINKRTQDFLVNGKHVRGYLEEIKNYHSGLKRAEQANDFGAMPIRVFTSVEIDEKADIEKRIDAKKRISEKIKAQKEFTNLSTNGKQFLINANHSSIFTKKKNAAIICKEIYKLLEK